MTYLKSIFNKKSIFWMVCAIIIWIVLLVELLVSLKNGNDEFTYSFASYEEHSDIPLDVSIVISKSWDDTEEGYHLIGAQYDGTVINKTGKEVRDWRLTITLPSDDCLIDSSWNGTYELNGRSLTVVPDEYVYIIEKDNLRSFGFILKSEKECASFKYEISGRHITYKEEYAIYWILILTTVVYAVTFIVYAVMQIKLEMRRRNDDEIIRQTMMSFVNSIDARDEYTKGHSVRVAEYSSMLAKELGFTEEEVRKIGYIALLHDCGKIIVSDTLLKKTGKLTAEERSQIQQHTVIGGKMLEDFTSLKGAREGALYHHEYFNGEGYPQGLKGEEIPLPARIICVADSFDAMNSDRCYRNHLGRERIINELIRNKCVQFDPVIADCMLKLIESGKISILE
ncbi:MAG: HD domain-containing protein [Lachnospiraceae bacterium]|nr:HD domain-containing protein [Lachnospiraceae bacterium]